MPGPQSRFFSLLAPPSDSRRMGVFTDSPHSTRHMPTLQPITPPRTLGREAFLWLADQGFVANEPYIRSSDQRGLEDPFSWYLSRRLNLCTCLSYSKALTRGTWFHTVMRLWGGLADPATLGDRTDRALSARLIELSDQLDRCNIQGDTRLEVLAREERDAISALAWFRASSTLAIPGDGRTFTQYLTAKHWTWVCFEPRPWIRIGASQKGIHLTDERTHDGDIYDIRFGADAWPFHLRMGGPDLILYHNAQDSVWLVEYKTTGHTPLHRLDTCSTEFQSHHNLDIVSRLMRDGTFFDTYPSIPRSAKLGGIIHLAIQKPTIEFGMMDRDHDLDNSPLKSGPRKGQPRAERIYRGEPRFDNYLERCKSWYQSTGQYSHLATERLSDPPVNISIVPGSILMDPYRISRYNSILRQIVDLATRIPYPENFPPGSDAKPPQETPLWRLRHMPPCDWPAWLLKEHVEVLSRDPHIPAYQPSQPSTRSGILPEDPPPGLQ